jgi:cytidine deaminase
LGQDGRVGIERTGTERLDTELLVAATTAHLRAYCPYSHYRVGVAIRTGSGSVVVGCNVENAAYPLGSCAEAGAIAAMVAAGERSIVEIVVVTDGDTPGTPCGGCRQRIREFAGPDVVVYSVGAGGAGAVVTMTVAELLPHSFGPEFLDSDRSAVHPKT